VTHESRTGGGLVLEERGRKKRYFVKERLWEVEKEGLSRKRVMGNTTKPHPYEEKIG